jgi:hypothetical protein
MGIENATLCEVRLIRGAGRVADRSITEARLPAVPAVGEVVSVDGWRLVVRERSWSLNAAEPGAARELRCCLRVLEVREEDQ